MLNALTYINEIPIAIIARCSATTNSRAVIMIVLAIVGLRLPILDTTNPEEGAKTKSIVMKYCAFHSIPTKPKRMRTS